MAFSMYFMSGMAIHPGKGTQHGCVDDGAGPAAQTIVQGHGSGIHHSHPEIFKGVHVFRRFRGIYQDDGIFF